MKRALFTLLLFPQLIGTDVSSSRTRIDHVRGLRVRLERPDGCEQIDGRARACPGGPTRYFASHWDHEHIPFFPPRGVDCLVATEPPTRFRAWRKLRACDSPYETRMLIEGTADWDNNRASRVFFLPRLRVLVLADLPAEQVRRQARALRRLRANWILLPRSGAIGSEEARALRTLAPKLGFIAGGLKPRAFDPGGKILLRATDWGNLIFSE